MIVLKAEQENFLHALQMVSGIVERRHTLPILANVLIRKSGPIIEFITSDLEIQIRTSAELGGDMGDFSTTVGSRKIIDILRSLPSDQKITLTANENRLFLQGGKSRFTLQTMPADAFPIVQEAADFGPMFSLPQKTLRDLINQVFFAMAVHDIRYYFNGAYFLVEDRTLTLVACDGHRLALAQSMLEIDVAKQVVILPRKTILELQRLLKDRVENEDSHIEIYFAGNQAKFKFNNMEFVSKLIEGRYPDYDELIKKIRTYSVTVGRQVLLSSLQRVALLTSEKFKGVRLNIEAGLLRMTANNSEHEEATEELEIDYTGASIEIGFNVSYLIEALANMSVEMIKLEFENSGSSVLMTVPEEERFKYVVMPLHI